LADHIPEVGGEAFVTACRAKQSRWGRTASMPVLAV